MLDFAKNYSNAFDLYLKSILPSIRKYNAVFIIISIAKYIIFILLAIFFFFLIVHFQEVISDKHILNIYSLIFTSFAIIVVLIMSFAYSWIKRINYKIRPLILNFLGDINRVRSISNLKEIIENNELYCKPFDYANINDAYKITYPKVEYSIYFIEIKNVYYTKRNGRKEDIILEGVLFIFNNAKYLNYNKKNKEDSSLKYYSKFHDKEEDKLYILTEYNYTLPQLYSSSEKAVRKYAEENYHIFNAIMKYAENIINEL